jgi:Tol biopolymer transport system component
LAAALVLVSVGAIWRWIEGSSSSSKPPTLPLKTIPFTSYRGQQWDAAFSPDGNQIAFSWDAEKEDNWHIYVKLIGAEKPLQLTADADIDRHPAWSPDGRYVAFLRHSGNEDGIFIVPALGGKVRRVRSLSLGSYWDLGSIDWSEDGKYLVFCDNPGGQEGLGIFWLSLENPIDEHVLTPPSPGFLDVYPHFSPDGRKVALVRSVSTEHAGDIYLVSRLGGEPSRLTFDKAAIGGLVWTSDGKYLVFSSERLGDTYRLWKMPAIGGGAEPLSAGQQNAAAPALSRDGRRLAYTHSVSDTNIWRFEVDRAEGRSTVPTELIASTEQDLDPHISPDGKRVVFASNRTGTAEIWVCESDGSKPQQVTSHSGPAMAGTPRWSPDGQQIAFDFDPDGHPDIYVVNPVGGRARRLTTGTSNNVVPSWSNDGRWVYFASDRTGTTQVWKMPIEGGLASQVTHKGGFAAFESPDDKTLYYAKGKETAGLWEVPVEGGEERPVLPQLSAGYWGYWGVLRNGIYFFDTGTRAIELFSFRTHQMTRIGTPQKPAVQWAPGLTISPDGQWLLFAQSDQRDATIMLVENFRL